MGKTFDGLSPEMQERVRARQAERAADPRTDEQRYTDARAVQAAEEAVRQAQNALDRVRRYTAETLIATVAEPDPVFPGPARVARYLLELDTPARRMRAESEAYTLSNLMGGRHSDRVHEAVQTLKRMIAEGREDAEMYGERTARQYREAEATRRDAEMAAAARAAGFGR